MERARDRRAGLTLLELVLVMFLLALILGSGVGFFSAHDLGRGQVPGLVRNVLRSAQNTALATHGPARVRIDKAAGTIWAESLITVGTYQFEGREVVGQGPAGSAAPEHFDPRGYLGACFRPAGKLKATAEIPLERDSGFDFTLGFSIELALLRESEAGGRVFSLGPSESPTVGLDLAPTGALRARFRTRTDGPDSERPGGSVIVQSEPGLVGVGRWFLVRLTYDRRRFELFLEGVRVAGEDQEGYVWKVDSPLVLSDPALPFPGRLDSLVIGVQVAGEPAALPETVRFAPDTPATIQFAASGGLDRTAHVDPPRIGLEFQDGSRETVTVGLYGTVE
jgi:hypothetical protein